MSPLRRPPLHPAGALLGRRGGDVGPILGLDDEVRIEPTPRAEEPQ